MEAGMTLWLSYEIDDGSSDPEQSCFHFTSLGKAWNFHSPPLAMGKYLGRLGSRTLQTQAV